MIEIVIPGEMRGKGRPRFSTRGGFARAFTDTNTANMETWVRSCAVDQVGQPMLEGPLALTVTIGVAIPASWPKKRRAEALAGRLRPTGKPDADNTVKLLADALNKIVWHDDAQVTDLLFAKHYVEVPRTVLVVRAAR